MQGPDRSRPCRQSLVASFLLAALGCFSAARGGAPTCAPAFIDNGLAGTTRGTNGLAIIEYKDGLYLGQASDVGQDGLGLMRRVGNGWEPVGGGLTSPIAESFISSMVVYNNLLIASGVCGLGSVQSNIVAWDGQSFVDIYNSTVPIGAISHNGWIRALAVFDPDASGPLPESLVVVGEFSSIGGDNTLNQRVRWDGTSWHPMYSGGGPGGPFSSSFFPHRLVVVDPDGTGPNPETLFMLLSDAAGSPRCLSKWNTASYAWEPFGGPFVNNEGGSEIIFDLTAFDPDDSGPEPVSLVAAGTVFGPNRVAYLSTLSGNTWQPLPGAPAGVFANSNTHWVSLAVNDPDGAGPQHDTLFMGRGFELSLEPISAAVYAYNGSSYGPISSPGLFAARSLNVISGLFRDFDQPTVYAAGQSAGPLHTARAMRHDGFQFRPAAESVSVPFAAPENTIVTAMMGFDSGVLEPVDEPPALVVALQEDVIELRGQSAFLQLWNGRSFEPFVPGHFSIDPCCMGVEIKAMVQIDPDGDGGPQSIFDGFVVVGDFDSVDMLDGSGPQTAYGVAVWDGIAWGSPNTQSANVDPRCVTPLPSGISGGDLPGLFVGGAFGEIGGVSCSNAAIWRVGTPTWLGMGLGVNGIVHDAVVFDLDGESGTSFDPALYVAGEFTIAGGQPSQGLAVWNGFSWLAVTEGVNGPVFDLQLWDRDGAGGVPPALAVAGNFLSAGTDDAQGFARLDESGWVGLGDAAGFEYGTRLAVLDPDGSGSAGDKLYAVLSNLAANRRFAGLRQTAVTTWVWDSVASLGPPAGDGSNSLITVDDDGVGLNPESIVIAGDMLSPVGGVPTDGLIRFAAPQRFLVDEIFATLNGAGAYLCGTIAGATDDVIFDHTAITGNPDAQGYADLLNSVTFGTLSVLSGRVTLDLYGNDMFLTEAVARPSLMVGDGRLDAVSLTLFDGLGSSALVSTQDVTLAASPTPHFVPQELSVDDVELDINGFLRISPESAGGYMVVRGPNAELHTSRRVTLAENAGTNGELFFSNGASWTHSGGGNLIVGIAGYANLDVDSGAVAATVFDNVLVAVSSGSFGSVDIGENGSAQWTQNGGSVFVGELGDGLLKVRNGSTFTGLDCHLIIGHLPGSSGELFVSDNGLPDSIVSFNELSIGRFGGDGLLVLDGGYVNAFSITIGRQGTLKGAGSLVPAATLTNQGLLTPGALPDDGISAGEVDEIDIFGNYTQVSAPDNQGIPGRLAVDIGLAGSVSEADLLVVSGIADLGGQLDVRFVDGYTPASGELSDGVPVIFSDNPIVGSFDVANFPGLSAGLTGAPRFLRFENRSTPKARGAFEVVIIEDTLASPPPAPAASSQDYDVGGAGTDADLGDLNGDGIIDIAITVPNTADPVNSPGSVVLLFNAGSTGGFWQGFTSTSQITVAANPSAIVVADFDGVLGNDLCFTSLTDATVHVMLNDGAGNFSFLRGDVAPLPVSGPARHLIESDFNRDGGADVAVITEGDPTVTVLFNSRPTTGAFSGFIDDQVIPIPPTSADGVAADIDNDKWDEIIIPDENSGSITVVNNGPAALRGGLVFNPVPVPVAVAGALIDVDASDLNLDGFTDVAFAARDGDTITILLGNGTATFLPPITVPAGDGPSDLALIDLDNDNDDDVAVITTDELGQRIVRVIRNDLFGGQLSFATQSDLLPGATPELVLGGDVTNDGNPDLVTVNDAGGVRGVAGPDDNDVSVFTFAVCQGDANNDRVVDMSDVSATLTNWLADYSPGTGPGDSNGDGVVTFADITSALTSWGRDCR